MELTKEKASQILKMLGLKWLPGKGSAIEQATRAIEEKGFLLKEDGEIYRTITQEDLDANPELIAEGVQVGEEVGLGELKPNDVEEDKDKSKKGKATMKMNVLHDGVRYDIGKEYQFSAEVMRIFTDKKFI